MDYSLIVFRLQDWIKQHFRHSRNNAFNAVGMRKLAEVIAKSKKERAEIDADSEVSVRRASMEASRQRSEIDLEERKAEIAQQQEIETLAAIQLAEIARQKAPVKKIDGS